MKYQSLVIKSYNASQLNHCVAESKEMTRKGLCKRRQEVATRAKTKVERLPPATPSVFDMLSCNPLDLIIRWFGECVIGN